MVIAVLVVFIVARLQNFQRCLIDTVYTKHTVERETRYQEVLKMKLEHDDMLMKRVNIFRQQNFFRVKCLYSVFANHIISLKFCAHVFPLVTHHAVFVSNSSESFFPSILSVLLLANLIFAQWNCSIHAILARQVSLHCIKLKTSDKEIHLLEWKVLKLKQSW